MVFDPATVELNIPVAMPLLFVGACCVNVFPLPVAESTTVAPAIARPLLSFTVTVIVELPLPAVIDVGDALTVDFAADTTAEVTVTVAVWVMAVPLAVAETVFDPAAVELSAPVATPLALFGPPGWVSVLPLPVAASATVAPPIGLPLASFTVTVIVDVLDPAGIDAGDAATVDRDADTGPAVNVTPAVWKIAVPFAAAEMVFDSATVELSVPVATPVASVVPLGCVRVLPLPVAARTTVAPLIALPASSFTVTVIVALPLPAASDVGDALSVDCEGDTDGTDPWAAWHTAEPESLKVLPATGTNCQV